MDLPDTRTYTVEPAHDTLGDGFRIYDSFDTVYEARDHGAWESRIYSDGEEWEVAVSLGDDADDPAAYLQHAAERIEAVYDVSFTPSLADLDEEVEEDGIKSRHAGDLFDDCIELSAGRGSVDTEPIEADLPSMPVGTSYGFGYGIGYAAIELFAPGAGALTWAVMAGGGAQLVGEVGPFLAELAVNRRRRDRYEEMDILDDETHFEQVSELNRLEGKEWDFDSPLTEEEEERLEELRDEEVEADHTVRMNLHFKSFTDRDGYCFTTTEESYADAVSMVGTVLDRDFEGRERPSIYNDQEAFKTVFERLDTEDRTVLAGNVIDREDVDPAVVDFLDTSYPHLVEDAGDDVFVEGA